VDIQLQASDGNRFAALHVSPQEPTGVGVVLSPDVRGLFPEYEQIAGRLADAGSSVVAIDWFGRSAGVGKREEGFDFMAHTLKTTAEEVQLDIAAAIDYLRSPAAGSCSSIFTVGFSFGGRHSILAGAQDYNLAGAVGFYFMPGDKDRPPFMESSGRLGPTQRAGELSCPVLGIWAGEDHELGIYPEDVAAFETAMEAAGVEHEVVTYEGVPHSFLDRASPEHPEVQADAWARVLAFIEAHKD
jgi:carboxymethylenebutenolidase